MILTGVYLCIGDKENIIYNGVLSWFIFYTSSGLNLLVFPLDYSSLFPDSLEIFQGMFFIKLWRVGGRITYKSKNLLMAAIPITYTGNPLQFLGKFQRNACCWAHSSKDAPAVFVSYWVTQVLNFLIAKKRGNGWSPFTFESVFQFSMALFIFLFFCFFSNWGVSLTPGHDTCVHEWIPFTITASLHPGV